MIFYLHDVLEELDELDQLTARVSLRQLREILLIIERRFKWIDIDLYLEKHRHHSLTENEVALSFDDGHQSMWHVVQPELEKYQRRCAFMISSAPYDLQFSGLLPHQYVEAVYRLQSFSHSDYRDTKKRLKKRARLEGADVYFEWLQECKLDVSTVRSAAMSDERFKFMTRDQVQQLAQNHLIVHHGHSHLPLGTASSPLVLNDQLMGREIFNSKFFALPYGDLEGSIPEELRVFSTIFGTEGPYPQAPNILLRLNAQTLLTKHSS